ncbi:MAG: hypothetical protein GX902_01230 [Lentisphaerae bacterium]|nr:hypothetical protein [Lentisphaerota bacterium]
MKKRWPLVIARQMLCIAQRPEFIDTEIEILRNYPEAWDEVWFSTPLGFPTLEEHRKTAELLAKLAEPFRRLDIGVALSLANEIGHGTELQGPTNGVTWEQKFTAHDGEVLEGRNCPRTPEFLEYLREMIRIYMQILHPDAIWLNDDARIWHDGKPACFCPQCLEEFGRLVGKYRTLPELSTLLNKRDGKENPFRQQWLDFAAGSLGIMGATIADAAREIDPDCRMGAQLGGSGHPYASNLGPLLAGLSGPQRQPVGIRPGAGFYVDKKLDDMFAKGIVIARINSAARKSGVPLGQICYELESYPFARSCKTARTTVLESTMALSFGCDSVAQYNNGADNVEAPDFYARKIKATAEWRKLWLVMQQIHAQSLPYGINSGYSPTALTRVLGADEPDWAWASVGYEKVFYSLLSGLPFVIDAIGSFTTLLHRENASTYSDAELRKLFAGKVIVDGEALEILAGRKLSFDPGVTAIRIKARVLREKFTADPLNGTSAGRSFYTSSSSVYKLECHGPARVLSVYQWRFQPDREDAGIASAWVQNSLGGVTLALGYNGIPYFCSDDKQHQLLNLCNALAGDGGMPVRLETPGPLAVFPRIDPDGSFRSIAVYNHSNDSSGKLTFTFRTPPEKLCCLGGGSREIAFTRQGNTVVTADLPGHDVLFLYRP